jgi:hypothetical protein
MATRAEQFRAVEQKGRSAKKRRPARTKPGNPPALRKAAKKHAARKATYALEDKPADKRPSRKSTRSSANRAKPDTNFNLRESMQKGSPEARFRAARARASRARGSPR